MTDEEMVAYLARCQLDPAMPRAVDRDAAARVRPAPARRPHASRTRSARSSARSTASGSPRSASASDAVWIPYIRPGLRALEARRGGRRRRSPRRRFVLLAKHGLVTWGDTRRGVVRGDARGDQPGGGVRRGATAAARPSAAPRRPPLDAERRDELLAAVLPALRGAVSVDGPRILQVDTSPAVLEFVCGEGVARALAGRRRVPRPSRAHEAPAASGSSSIPSADDADALRERLVEGVRAFQERERAYFERYRGADDRLRDPSPRVVLVAGSRARLGRAHAEGGAALRAISITARSP